MILVHNEMRVNIKIQTLGAKTGCHFSSDCSILHIIANYTLRQPPHPAIFNVVCILPSQNIIDNNVYCKYTECITFYLLICCQHWIWGEGILFCIWTSNSGKSFGGQCLSEVKKMSAIFPNKRIFLCTYIILWWQIIFVTFVLLFCDPVVSLDRFLSITLIHISHKKGPVFDEGKNEHSGKIRKFS